MLATPDLPARWRNAKGDILTGMGPERLAQVLREADRGYIRPAQLLFTAIEGRDLDIVAALPKRRAAAAMQPWDVVIASEIDDRQQAEAALHREALLYAYSNIEVRDALDLDAEGEMRLLIEQMVNAVFAGYAMHEIAWRAHGRDLTAQLTHCHPALFETTTGGLRFAGPETQLGKAPLIRDEWIVTRGYGLSTALSIGWMLTSLCLRDQLAFLSRYGMPGVLGTTTAPKGSQERAYFESAVGEFGNLWAAVVGDGNKIDLVTATASGGDQWSELREEIKRAKVAICMGSDLSTMSKGNGVGASVQKDDNDTLNANDLLLVTETLNRRFDRMVIRHVFGEGVKPLAYAKLSPPITEDDKGKMDRVKFLREMGIPQSKREVAEAFGHTLPERGVEVISMVNSASPATSLDGLKPITTFPAQQWTEAAKQAVATDLEAVLKRLAEIATAGDDADIVKQLEALQSDMPALTEQVLNGSALDDVFAAHQLGAFIEGLNLTSILEEVTKP